MSTASITQVQGKGLRQFFAEAVTAVRDFSVAMYAARDREFAHQAAVVAMPLSAREQNKGLKSLLSLAKESEAHSPSLAAELRYIAGRG